MSTRALTELEEIISPFTDCKNSAEELASILYQRIAEIYNIDEWGDDSNRHEKQVSVDCERQIESDFTNALFGIIKNYDPHKPYLVTNYLRSAYDTGRAQGLRENLILKYCCTVLTKIINDNITEKISASEQFALTDLRLTCKRLRDKFYE